ncbi:MAG TPA: response regulator [Candidatus Paceibacterota bacterium]
MADEKQNKKVLIIEDDKFLGELLYKRLSQENFFIDLATDGESGITKAVELRPDIILLDILLPGMNGYAVLEKLKADPALKDIPVIILSNLGQKGEIEKGLALGAADFLIKAEFDLNDIVGKIQGILNK